MTFDPTGLPTLGQSAFVGQPPNTLHDYYIIKGLFRITGMTAADPMAGFLVAPKPPPGYTHESRVGGVLAGMIVVIVFIVVPTGARLILRARKDQMKFGSDDWAILAAATLALSYPIAQICGLYVGGGSIHIWEVTYSEYDTGAFIGMLCKMIFYEAVGLIKISIALFIRRLAKHTSSRWRLFCDIFIATVVAYLLLAFFWMVFACNPPKAQWFLYSRGSHLSVPQCVDTVLQARVLSGVHVAQGFVLLSTPIIILWKIQMDRPKKIRLFIFWVTGGICVLGGLLRQIRTKIHADMTWEYVEYLGTTCLDLVLGLLTASLPVLDGIFPNVWHKITTASISTKESAGRVRQSGRSRDGSPLRTDQHSESCENIVSKDSSHEMNLVSHRSLRAQESSASSFADADAVMQVEARRVIHQQA